MLGCMTTTNRVVPILTVQDIVAEREHYCELLGLREVMNHGWIATLADESGQHQLSLMTTDLTAAVNPRASVEVDDLDAAYAAALAQGLEIVHELRDEPWGVRRFFFRDFSGNVINVLSHRETASSVAGSAQLGGLAGEVVPFGEVGG